MSEPAVQSAEAATLTDLDVDLFTQTQNAGFRQFALILPLIGALAVWGMSAAVISAHFLFVAIVGLALAAFAFMWRGRQRRAARIRALIAADRPSSVAQAIEIARQKAGIYAISAFLPQVAAGCVAAGLAGSTVRTGPRSQRSGIEPISFAFEPRLLSQSDAGFQSLNDAAAEFAAQRTAPASAGPALAADRRRTMRARAIPLLFLMLVSIFVFIFTTAQFGRFDLGSALLLGLPLGVIVWFWAARGLLRERQWLLVPAALVLRTRHWRRPGWTLRMFTRRESVLLACVMAGKATGLSFVSIADARGVGQLFATPWELDILLRAWLSPLEPPIIDKLSDLT